MILKHKKSYKPFYKKLINLRNNPQDKKKIFNFKKQKWSKFIKFYERKLKWYNKFKPQNFNLYLVSRYSDKYSSYKRRYKNTLTAYKNFNLFYGNLNKKFIKNNIFLTKKKVKFFNEKFIEIFEKRLDVVLYRAKFCHSIRSARQLIKHKIVSVNHKLITNKSHKLKTGDLIKINLKYSNLVKSNIRRSNFWPIPPKYLLINYKTFQIVFCELKHTNTYYMFSSYLNLEKILINYIRQ